MIGVVDYGVGNLFSLAASLAYLGLDSQVSAEPSVLQKADRLILPGVGAFGDAAQRLRSLQLDQFLAEEVERGKPLLGICLGMQLLLEESEEYGSHKGLGLIPGRIASLQSDLAAAGHAAELKVPHMGWNALQIRQKEPLFRYVEEGEYVYYVHSFYAKDCDSYILAESEYGISVVGAVGREGVYGTQFHPEKSGQIGLKILQAFAEL